MSKDLNLFAAGEPTGGEWNIRRHGRDNIDVQQKGFRLGLGAEYQLIEGGWLYVMVGAEGGRELQVAVDDEEVFDDEMELDDCAFLQIGFRLN
jgi:hypothetical protein